MALMEKIKKLRALVTHRKLLRNVVSSYLFCLKDPGKSIWGSITEEDEQGVRQAVMLARDYEGPIVEIGVLFGHTTNLIASLKQEGVPLIGVENFTWNPFCLPADVHRQFTKRTLRYVLDHCATRIFDGNAEDFYSANKTLKPSLVFIDAFHDYKSVRRDIDWAVSTGCPIISGHDYTDIHPGVIKAVNETFGDTISLYGSVWVHKALQGSNRL